MQRDALEPLIAELRILAGEGRELSRIVGDPTAGGISAVECGEDEGGALVDRGKHGQDYEHRQIAGHQEGCPKHCEPLHACSRRAAEAASCHQANCAQHHKRRLARSPRESMGAAAFSACEHPASSSMKAAAPVVQSGGADARAHLRSSAAAPGR